MRSRRRGQASYAPHLFDNANTPLLFRDETRLPIVEWRQSAETFDMESIGRFYDYIVTHPKARHIVAGLPPGNVRLLREAGEWRIYEVLKSAPTPQ